jgi:hypothetical protein
MENIIKDFKKLTENGSIALTKLGDAYVVSVRKFDPSTGEPSTPDVFALDLVVISKLKISANELLENIEFTEAKIASL